MFDVWPVLAPSLCRKAHYWFIACTDACFPAWNITLACPESNCCITCSPFPTQHICTDLLLAAAQVSSWWYDGAALPAVTSLETRFAWRRRGGAASQLARRRQPGRWLTAERMRAECRCSRSGCKRGSRERVIFPVSLSKGCYWNHSRSGTLLPRHFEVGASELR